MNLFTETSSAKGLERQFDGWGITALRVQFPPTTYIRRLTTKDNFCFRGLVTSELHRAHACAHARAHTHVKFFFKEAKIRCTGTYPFTNTLTYKCKRNPRGETIA